MHKKDLLADLCTEVMRANWLDNSRPALLLRAFDTARDDFRRLIDSAPREQEIQGFLELNPVILLHAVLDGFYPVASTRSCLFSKVQLGSEYELDFAYCSGNSMGTYWTFIELERPDAPLFNKAGDPTKHLSHAFRQVFDWVSWVSDNQEYAKELLDKLVDGSPLNWRWPKGFRKPLSSVIVIGRRSMLNENTNRLRAQICEEHRGLEIITYDRLFDHYNVGKDPEQVFSGGSDQVGPIREIRAIESSTP